MEIKPGFWDCCQAKPTKIVAFDGEHGELAWHYACPGCASTVHSSRVQDAPVTTTDLYEIWFQDTTITINPGQRLLMVTNDEDEANYIASQLREQLKAIIEVRLQPSVPTN